MSLFIVALRGKSRKSCVFNSWSQTANAVKVNLMYFTEITNTEIDTILLKSYIF